MVDTVKWSAFPSGSTIAGTDITVGLQGGANVQWTYNQAATFFWNSPTLVTPTLGVATATSVNKVAITAPAAAATLTIANGKTFTVNNSLALTGTDATTLTFPGTSDTIPGVGTANTFTQPNTFANVVLGSANTLAWSTDLFVSRAAANVLAQRNGTTAQNHRVYNSDDGAGNTEYLQLGWTASVLTLAGVHAGTGVARSMAITSEGNITITYGAQTVTLGSASGAVSFNSANLFSIPAGGAFIWTGRSTITSPANSTIQLRNNAGTDFGLLQFGGATASFPALKKSSTTLQSRLADDSAFSPLQGKITTDANATTGLVAGALAALTNASIVIYDATGTAYRVPCVTP